MHPISRRLWVISFALLQSQASEAGVEASLPRVVIVGGGFGGLFAARALARAPLSVPLIDKRNYHLFRPMLYQVEHGTKQVIVSFVDQRHAQRSAGQGACSEKAAESAAHDHHAR